MSSARDWVLWLLAGFGALVIARLIYDKLRQLWNIHKWNREMTDLRADLESYRFEDKEDA